MNFTYLAPASSGPVACSLLVAFITGGCIGVNPEYDAPVSQPDDDSGHEVTGGLDDDHDDHDGSTSTPSWTTTGYGTTGNAVETSGPDATSTTGLPSGSTGSEIEACLAMGLDVCRTDAQIECVDLQVDVNHCGECFNACGPSDVTVCNDGQCDCRGGMWWAMCDGHCAHVRSDPAACGSDCIDCTELHGPDALCEHGECQAPDDDDDDDD